MGRPNPNIWVFGCKLTEISVNGWSPKIPKRPNFRFSPDVWVVPNEKIWASAQKIERGGFYPKLCDI